MPTLSATSEVIGDLLARPRIPSVPKYRRDMGIPLARFCSFGLPFRELDCISYLGRSLLASMVNARRDLIAAPEHEAIKSCIAGYTPHPKKPKLPVASDQ